MVNLGGSGDGYDNVTATVSIMDDDTLPPGAIRNLRALPREAGGGIELIRFDWNAPNTDGAITGYG